MILVKVINGSVSSELMRDAAKNYNFDPNSVIHIGPYIGYKDAPNPTTEDIRAARDGVIKQLEDTYNLVIKPVSAEDAEAFLRDRLGDRDLPEWYTPIDG